MGAIVKERYSHIWDLSALYLVQQKESSNGQRVSFLNPVHTQHGLYGIQRYAEEKS